MKTPVDTDLQTGPTTSPYQRFPDQPWEEMERWYTIERAIRQNSPKNIYTKHWKPICKNLALILGHQTFKFCFLKASLVRLTRDTAVIEFEDRFKRDYVRDFYMQELMRAIRFLHPMITDIGMKAAPQPLSSDQEEIFYTRKNPASPSGSAASYQGKGDLA